MTETESRLYDVDELNSAEHKVKHDAEARSTGSTEVAVTELRVEHRRPGDTVGIGERSPRLSWMTTTERQGWRQAAYEIEVARSEEGGPWSSGRVDGYRSGEIPESPEEAGLFDVQSSVTKYHQLPPKDQTPDYPSPEGL